MASISVDFRYTDVAYELWALEHMLGTAEGTISTLATNAERRTLAELREKGLENDEAEVDLAWQVLHDTKEYVLPRFVRGPFLVALWACYESAILHIAAYRAKELGANLQLDDIRGALLRRAKLYFTTVLGDALDVDETRFTRLADLYRIRNALAHANGQRVAMSEKGWKDAGDALARHGMALDEHRGVIVPTDEYLHEAFSDVSGSLGELVERLRSHGRAKPTS